MKLIITADDLGASPEVNDAILSCLEEGVISRASVLANGNALSELEAHFQKGHTFGLHFNMTEGRALRTSNVFGVDEDGVFNYRKSRPQFWNRARKDSVRNELLAQIESLRSLGMKIDYADSHHHIHTDIGMASVFASTCASQNIFQSRPARTDLARTAIHMLWKKRANQIFVKKGLKIAEHLYDIKRFDRAQVDGEEYEVVELMLHPIMRNGRVEDSFRPGEDLVELLKKSTGDYELIYLI